MKLAATQSDSREALPHSTLGGFAGASPSSAAAATAVSVGVTNGVPSGVLDVRAIGPHVRVESCCLTGGWQRMR